ncbi:valine--tRNA ligase [bacterium]|nr:MAG: valine--tRNA ligase [bacterium]
MTIRLEKTYDPKAAESKWYKWWEENGFFKPSGEGEPFTIVIPPPNVTDVLHLGHALNNLIQDVLVRHARMRGYSALWLPGTDHAGIATQHMVSQELAKEGITKEDIGREKFVERLWKWKEDKGGRIVEQLKEIGCSCDWSRTRFTMDEGYARAVREAFVKLYEEGLVYRGKYIINWCPKCKTALSDEEVEHKPVDGKLWYFDYPLEGGGFIGCATTRPETMLGDTAVAVNPKDERYRDYVGKIVVHPFLDRKFLVIADDYVDTEFGTGAVKVTPAHDPNDFEIGNRHNLDRINILTDDGKINANGGPFEGMDRFEARDAVVKGLEEKDLLKKVETHELSAGHCYRCETLVEPFLSDQWFLNMKPLAEPALDIVRRGLSRFYPERWQGVYYNWLENIRPWCISRQLWWGHRIPVWFCDCSDEPIVSRVDLTECPRCGNKNIRREDDVLDTWFSSWLWPFATLGWPEMESADLKRFFPTDVLVTASEIIFFWVARMIMASEHFMGETPFHSIYIHGTVRDTQGRKMSKSLGNGIDPLDVIERFGRDALRFSLLAQAGAGQDLFVDMDSFEQGRNFCNKLWNASRLVLGNIEDRISLEELKFPPTDSLVDRWILSRLQRAKAGAEEALVNYRLDEAINTLYHFFWGDFCDVYLEAVKHRFAEHDKAAQIVALHVLEQVLRLWHPVVPFVTEDIWQKIKDEVDGGLGAKGCIVARWPIAMEELIDDGAETEFGYINDIAVALRNIKTATGIGTRKVGNAVVVPADDAQGIAIMKHAGVLEALARIESIKVQKDRPDGVVGTAVVTESKIFLPLEGIVDIEAERARLDKEIERLEGVLNGLKKRLSNDKFIENAPEEVVENARLQSESIAAKIKHLRNARAAFG